MINRQLYAERLASHCPWTISPFKLVTKSVEDIADEAEMEDLEIEDEKEAAVILEVPQQRLKVRVANEVPWVDLVSGTLLISYCVFLTIFRFWRSR